jgi:hypothetical protein
MPELLVVHPDRRRKRVLARLLSACGAALQQVEDLAQAEAALERAGVALTVVDSSLVRSTGWERFAQQLSRTVPRPYLLVVAEEIEHSYELLGRNLTHNIVAGALEHCATVLLATASKALSGDLLGLEKYIGWGAAVAQVELAAVHQRAALLDALVNRVMSHGLGHRVATRARIVADELLTNAVYNAPVDPDGRHYQAERSREEELLLGEAERVAMRYAFDGQVFAVEVRDRFGSLPVDRIGAYLSKAARDSDEDKVLFGTGGAGIGMSMVYRCCDHLVYNLLPGSACEAIALFDLSQYPRAVSSSSFNLFVASVDWPTLTRPG